VCCQHGEASRNRAPWRVLGPPGYPQALNLLAENAARAGVLPVGEALDLLHAHPRPAIGRANGRGGARDGPDVPGGLDLLQGWQLHVPGSPVVWDRTRPGRLLSPVRRVLAASGPLPAEDVPAGVHRSRELRDPASSPAPTAPALLAWTVEHPGLRVLGDGRLALPGHPGPALAELS